MSVFHNKPFDEPTKLKLEIFRNYIREWLPVFTAGDDDIFIYDFFSGPGYDSVRNPGTPIILTNEIKSLCEKNKGRRGKSKINIKFNDVNIRATEGLKRNIENVRCKKNCCNIEIFNTTFHSIYELEKSLISQQNPTLLIMDQFGVSDITPEMLSEISNFPRTDILFFISSSFIHRFRDLLGPKIGLKSDEKNIEFNTIHKHICNHLKSSISHQNYYLSPFSIKKGANIYGIIFGSSNLLGLEKFLKVCWSFDKVNGEANYNITGEPLYYGQMSLFQKNEEIKKIVDFKKRLLDFLMHSMRDNRETYKFCLENGVSLTKANEALRDLQNEKKIVVKKKAGNTIVRKGAFYLGWNNYKNPPIVIIEGIK